MENAQQSDQPISTTPIPTPSSQPQQPKPGSVVPLKSVIFTPDVEADIVEWIKDHPEFYDKKGGGLQAKLLAATTINPPARESEEEEEDSSQSSIAIQGPSSEPDKPQPTKSSIAKTARSAKPETATLTCLQRRAEESRKLTEHIEVMMEEAEDSRSSQMMYGLWLAHTVPQIEGSLIHEYYKHSFALTMRFVDESITIQQQ